MPIIAFDGLDGAGKTTQIAMLSKYLHLTYHVPPITIASFPKDTTLGCHIHAGITEHTDPFARQTAIIAAYLNIVPTITTLLKKTPQPTILLDRTIQLSSVTYARADGVSSEQCTNLLRLVEHAPIPDIAFFLDTNFQTSQQRLQQRNLPLNFFDTPTEEKFNQRRHYMYQQANLYPWARIIPCNEHSPTEIHKIILGYLEKI